MRRERIVILIILLCLLGIGTIMIYSASSIYAWNETGDSFYYLKRHLLFLLLGFVGMCLAMSLDHHILRKWAKPLFLFSILLLIVNLLPGVSRETAGARRWIRIGGFGFQPSELIKVTMILYLADFIARREEWINNFWHGVVPPLSAVGVTVLLILLQPDLGTALSIMGIAVIMFYAAGLSYRYFLYGGLLCLPVLYFLVFNVPYRRARILAFLDPWADPTGKGFQIIQSQIALGSGGLLGQGLGQGNQKLFYLPAAHTDFIFSVIVEEMGIVGGVALLLLFVLLLWYMIQIVRRNTDLFSRFLSFGIVSLIGLQVVINVGVSIGVLPTKGLPLPFVSYGGSSLVFHMIAMGLLLNVSRRKITYL